MTKLKAGDLVRINDRAATPQDMKSGSFFNHYRGLEGVVQKAYSSGEVAVVIHPESLREDIWKRHMDARDQMRKRWLEGLSDDVRRKLTPEQKQFELRYVVLVSSSDVEKRKRSGRTAGPVHKSL